MISGIESRYQRKSVRMRNRQLFDGERLARRLGEYGLDGLLNPSRTYTHDRLSIKCFHCVGATQRKHLTQGPRSNNQPTSAIASAAIITMPATARHVRSFLTRGHWSFKFPKSEPPPGLGAHDSFRAMVPSKCEGISSKRASLSTVHHAAQVHPNSTVNDID